jgi:hypothetical protein
MAANDAQGNVLAGDYRIVFICTTACMRVLGECARIHSRSGSGEALFLHQLSVAGRLPAAAAFLHCALLGGVGCQHQLLVRAGLDDPPRIQHHDLVSARDRRQPVRDDQRGASYDMIVNR